jgi:DNA primase
MSISRELLNKITSKLDIVEIVSSSGVTLTKKGANYVGLCPFHDDKNPSLTVSPDKQIYKCFSCGAGGDAIKYIKEKENIPFIDAVKKAADLAGISVNIESKYSDEQMRYFEIMENAKDFYQLYLNNTKDGIAALEYLKNRDIDQDLINRFQIGLSSNESNMLYNEFKKQFSELDLLNVGLIRKADSYYDTFQSRIIFPLKNEDGYIVGFSGRIYNQDDRFSKYLNSADNAIFNKGNILYNFSDAKTEIKKANFVYLFEGFMDVIALHKVGIDNTVAIMGTSLTDNQIRLIQSVTNTVVLSLDGDEAGIHATQKAIFLLNRYKFNTRVILLPDGLDPDDYLKKFGKDKLKQYYEKNSLSAIDYLYNIEKRKLNKGDVESKLAFKNSIFAILQEYNSIALNEIILKKLSEEIDVSIDSLLADFNKQPKKATIVTPEPPKRTGTADKAEQIRDRHLYYEQKLISMSLLSKRNCITIISALDNNFIDKDNYHIFLHLKDYYDKYEEFELELFIGRLSEKEKEKFNQVLNPKFEFEGNIEELVKKIKDYVVAANEKSTGNLSDIEKLGKKIKRKSRTTTLQR